MTQNDILLKHLSTIVDPELGVDIVELGMVKDITYKDATVFIQLALTIAECPMRNQIETEINRKLLLMENIDKVQIDVVAMNKKDRSAVMEKARKKARDNATETKIDPQTRVIAIGSGKGGVGKSTISTNIALGLEKQGYKTGLLDADIWGFSIPRLLGIQARLEAGEDKKIIPYKRGNLEVVSTGLITEDEDTALMWRGLMLSKALEQFLNDVSWGKLDYLIIDLPPGTGDIQMALGRLLPQAELIVVTTPQVTAQKVATRVADMAKRSFIPLLGVIENMSYFETDTGEKYEIFGEGGGEKLAEQFAIPLLMKIPLSENTTIEADKGIPLIEQEMDTPTKSSLNELVNKITDVLPPIADETCTGRIAKVFEELGN
ncbi:MAG: Mrp/NBP35 family ATP-binding protein [Candidatus Actinomarina sp.]|jgi:ATP-binding protein involved in chromosome partitioning|nr:Mrp/NBP35 family ATP-binding protein [Candidatus Actinomarina sp.]